MSEAAPELDPAHEDALRRLRRLFRSPGGRLVFAVGADDRIRAEVATRLGPIAQIELSADEPAPWARLEEGSALMVVLPRSCPHELLQRLNVGRERVVRQGLRLVLWLRELKTMDGVRLAAPDLWAHRAGWLPFLSEADLPVTTGPLPAPVQEQLRTLEARIETWPAFDKVGRFRAECDAVWLLTETGRSEEARRRAQALEKRWQKMRGEDRERCREAIETATERAAPLKTPHLQLADRRSELGNPSPLKVNRALTAIPRLERRLGWLVEFEASLRRPWPIHHAGAPPWVWAVNRASHFGDSGADRADLARLDQGLLEMEENFSRLLDGSRQRQEARFRAQHAQHCSRRAMLRGDWLEALRLVHSAAHLGQDSGAGATLDLLAFGQGVARDAGLSRLASAWFDRAGLLAEHVGLEAMAGWLATVINQGSLSPAQTASALPKAFALASTIENLALASQLLAAAGRAGAPDEARRELQQRMRRHGYPRFAAAKELAAMELDLGHGEAAAEAATAALDYAGKHGGPALIAELWLYIAAGQRLAARLDPFELALAQAREALSPLDEALLPATMRLALAQETGALHQTRGQPAEADTALWSVVDLFQTRGARLREHQALLAACRFGGPRREEAGQRSLELGIELGLPALEARSWLELTDLSLDAGTPADRRRLSQVQARLPAAPPPAQTPARAR